MTGGGGLVLFILGTMLGMVLCKPQECVKRPQWTTTDGKDLLHDASGDVILIALLRMTSHFGQQQALRMEILLQDLRDYGMLDLRFVIVNSKGNKSDEILNNFRRILSIPIYEENYEDLWTIIGGDDNDMFLFDRCDRITYFLPYPLSNLQDKHPVLRAAILSTYFRSPCGISCPSNEIVDNIEVQPQSDQQILEGSLTNEEAETVHSPNGTGVLVDVEDDFPIFDSETPSDEYEGMDDYNNPIASYNTSSTTTTILANVSSSDRQNTTSSPIQKSILSSFFDTIWGKGKQKESKNGVEEIISESFASNLTNDIQLEPEISIQVSNSNILETSTTAENTTDNNKHNRIDSCFGVDENVCMEWSKAKLMHAQRCCLTASYSTSGGHDKGCKNFSKKRCKKIQTLLKCCLKTQMSVSSTEEPLQGSPM